MLSGVAIVVFLMTMTLLDVGQLAPVWEEAHWLAASVLALAVAIDGCRRASGVERQVRRSVSVAIAFWLLGVIVWIVQSRMWAATVPAISDVVFAGALLPAAHGFHVGMRGRRDGDHRFVYLDGLLLAGAFATVLFTVFGNPAQTIGQQLLLGIPVAFLALAGTGLVAALGGGAATRNTGLTLLLAGCALIGVAYLVWIAEAPAVPGAGNIGNFVCSIGIVSGGIGAATLRLPAGGAPGPRTRSLLDLIPALAIGATVAILLARELSGARGDLVVLSAAFTVIAVGALRQGLLVRQRDTLIATQRELTDAARSALAGMTEAEERYRLLVERVPAIVYLDEAEAEAPGRSRLEYVSPQVTSMLGIEPDELINDRELWYRSIHPDDVDRVRAAEERHFYEGTPLIQEFRMRRKDGSTIWVRDVASLVPSASAGRRSHGVVLDVTAEKAVGQALRTSEDQLRRVIDTASSAFVGMDEAGVIVEWNRRAEETFGWKRAEAIGRRVGELIVPRSFRRQHEIGFRRLQRTGRKRTRGRRELVAVHRDGREFPVEIAMWAIEQDGSYRFSALIDDITERKRLEGELRRQAFADSLTGLANRALFIDRLGHALRRRGEGNRAAVLVADLDDFSQVNDALGHAAGDELLVQVAERMTSALKAGDTVARMGGDEFAILLEEIEVSLAEDVAQRILDALKPPFVVGGHSLAVHASIGVAASAGQEESEAVLGLADAAMHAAKRAGKGQVLRYRDEHRGRGVAELELRSEFRQALEGNQLRLAYQPIVDLTTHRPAGLEALVRWEHPSRGLLTPDRFLHLADTPELSGLLAAWVFREAAGQARLLAVQRRPLWISVNLSPRQLTHERLLADVQEAVLMAGIHPRLMIVEITEHGVMHDIDASARVLGQLKDAGIRIAIDDFGTGYSSLSHLARLPIDILKIDRSFIVGIGRSQQDRALVRAVTDLARSLRLQVIAEGIEDIGQVGHLRGLRVRLGQGYLFTPPLLPDDLMAWLDSRSPSHSSEHTPY